MITTLSEARRHVGERIPPFEVESLVHGIVRVPGDALVHLQFRRFAGCPICNLHLRRLAVGHASLVAAGIRTVAFFHASAEQMRPYHGELPFAVVPDAERRWYRAFGVERSARAALHPKAVRAAVRGLLETRASPFVGASEPTGLPADFLVAPSGELLAVHYGAHADDQWSVEDLLALGRAHAASGVGVSR